MYIPSHIKEVAEKVIENLLPPKYNNRYYKEYEIFIKCEQNSVTVNNACFIRLLYRKIEDLKSSTMWSIFSMLKSTLNIRHNINIGTFSKLIAY